GALFVRGLIVAFAGGAAFIALQALVFWVAFRVSPASVEVEALARDYLAIRIWGAPATIGLYVVTGWLIAMERARGVLVLQLWMNGLNIVLDLWFVLGLGWGVEGVAIATLIAEWSGLVLGLWLCRAVFAGYAWRDWARIADPLRLRRMVAVNADILLRNVILTGSFATFLFIAADIGDVTLAGNQVLLQFVQVTAFALDGFAFAAEALVGSAVGAGARERVRRAGVMASIWAFAFAIVLSAAFWLVGPAIIDMMTTSDAVRAEARIYLPWIVAVPLISAASYLLDGVFFGATWTRDMRIATLQAVAIYVVALVVLVPGYGNHGLWLALMVLNGARAVTLMLRYPRLERTVG
ncbi:MAG: MATE family efflux transporter, partial [Pseudomonadota bacterium]